MPNLYFIKKKLWHQNQFLQNLMDKYSTNDTKSVYLNEQMQTLIDINWWLFWIFIMVAILFSVFIFINPRTSSLSMLFKLCILLLACFYPYYIYPVEKYALNWFVYIKDMIMFFVSLFFSNDVE